MTGDLVLQSQPCPIQENTNKAVSYRAARDIVLSRKESLPMEAALDMNNKKIENLAAATSSREAVNKSYVDSEIAKILTINTSDHIKKDGSVAMTTDLNLDGNKITNVTNPDPNEPNDAVNIDYKEYCFCSKYNQ